MSAGRADYLPADAQMTPTVGPDMGSLEDVEAADEQTVRAVFEAIESPAKVPDPEPDNPNAVPMKADGSTGELPMMEIPGFGEAYDDCGDELPVACSGCGHTTTIGRTCRRSMCPRCGAAWVRDRAIDLCAELGAVRAVRDHNRADHQRYHHWVAVAPEDWRLEADDVLDRTRKVIRDIVYALDHDALVFYHPWSGSGYDDEEGDDRGAWKERLFNGREWAGDVREELEFRPHFHIISVGNTVPGGDFTRELYNETGWIFSRITKSEDSNVSLYDDKDLAAAVTYCLSHAAIDVGAGADGSAQRTYRRFGTVINDPDVEPDEDAKLLHDRNVREAATRTLGISMKEQFCYSDVLEGGGDPEQSIRSRIQAQAAPDPVAGAGDDDNLPDAPNDVLEVEAADDPGELKECEGRLIHLTDARDLLQDDDWVEQAEHVDELRETLDEWADRMSEIIRWGPFNAG